jgi:chemotaxis protein MotB
MNPSIRPIGILLSLVLAAAGPTRAADPAPAAPAPAPSFEEVQAMIARMQQRLDSLGSATAERDTALRFLEQQVDQATGEIAGTGKTNESLRGETAVLSNQLDGVSRDRERLAGEADERAAALAALQTQIAALSGELGQARDARSQVEQELAAARATQASADKRSEGIVAKLAALEQSAGTEASAAAAKIAKAEATAAASTAEADRLGQELAKFKQAALADAKAAAERIAATEAESKARAADLQPLRDEAAALRREIAQLNELLAKAETKVDQQQDAIDGLDAALAQAQARKVEELEQYRSEFFGRLKQALGDRPDLRVVGDRFVFQSELLFASGSASLDPDGLAQLRQLAVTLEEVAARIPPGIDWILRVDGHTDREPIRDAAFRSNWELSAARAISVIEFLTAQGIPPEHLAAAGFGEYRPIDPGDDEIAYRRNRRIEFKLTEG